MKKRVLTGILIGLVYIAVVITSAYVHRTFFDVFILFLMLFGAYEVSRVIEKFRSKPIDLAVLLLILIGYGVFITCTYLINFPNVGILSYLCVLIIAIIVVMCVCSKSKNLTQGNAVSTIVVMVYPVTLLMFSMAFNHLSSSVFDIGINGVLLFFAVSPFTDCMAYFVGSTIGGKKLCPNISPKKTISGAIGGLFGGILGGALIFLLAYLANKYSVNVLGATMLTGNFTSTLINFLIIGLLGSVFDQAGDLFASAIKRRAGVKDYSNLLPGHGGIIDRVDGAMFVGVLLYFYLSILTLVV